MDCYIVMGSTGEYEDHFTWPARVCLEKDTAEMLAKDFNKILEDLGVHRNSGTNMQYHEFDREQITFDPNFGLDYTGANYYVEPCPFNDEPPTQDDIKETYEVD